MNSWYFIIPTDYAIFAKNRGDTLKFEHKPVLLKECIEGSQIHPEGIYVDGTLGGRRS